LDLAGADVDVLAFDEALARDHPGHPQEKEAASLYRGPLLEDCAEEWVLPEREAREQAYLGALETLATQALAGEDAPTAARYLRRVITTDPLRESAYRALMEALSASGDYAAVTEVYRELRLLLHRELNTGPAAETIALFQRIREEARRRAQMPAPAPASTPARSREERAAAIVTTLRAPNARPNNLPQQLTSFIGRDKEITEIKDILSHARLLTLTGAGGSGKTRLAIQVAEEVENRFSDGVWWVELAPLTDPALIPQTIAASLRVREEPGRPPMETLIDHLQSCSLLLLLDNCEHLVDACAQAAERLLHACPNLRLLATSRHALGVPGEIPWNVPPLSLPDFRFSILDFGLAGTRSRIQNPESRIDKNRLSSLMEYEAVRLFVERAAAAMPVFRLTEQNAGMVAQICQRLEGIPLAIELAAARMRALSIEQIAARLDDRFRLLTMGSRAAPPRHQTLRGMMDWSYDLLSEEERALFRRLAVFAGGWTLEAAEAICSDFRLPEGETSIENQKSRIGNSDLLDLLTQLVDHSLVAVEAGPSGVMRYRMLETVRQYAEEKLVADGESEWMRTRHAHWFLQWAEEANPHLSSAEPAEWLDRLETEHDNFRAALDWCTDFRLPEDETSIENQKSRIENIGTGLRLVRALWLFWDTRGHIREGRRWAERVLAQAGSSEWRVERAKVLTIAGLLAWAQTDYAAARAYHEESLALAQEMQNTPGIASALQCLAMIAHMDNDLETARDYYERSLDLLRESGDRVRIAAALLNLGAVIHSQGEYARARALHEESLALRREAGDRRGVALTLSGLGIVCRDQGDRSAAQAHFIESLRICSELRNSSGTVNNLEEIAILAAGDGHPATAARLLGATEAMREAVGTPLPPASQGDRDRLVADLRAALGAEEFSAAWAAGRAMTPELATAYALEICDEQ